MSCWNTGAAVSCHSGMLNCDTETFQPARFIVSRTYATDAVYPGVSVCRVPPFMSAMFCSARWCSTMPGTVTARSSLSEFTSGGLACAARRA